MGIKVAVMLPSRGLIFSQTADELLKNLSGFEYEIFFAHELPLPQCFEKPLLKALNAPEGYTHFWFVEEDMILPNGVLKELIKMDVPVATCDYPVSREGQGAVFRNDEEEVIFAGTGCLLVKRQVFGKLKPPYFRTDIRWNAVNYGDFIRMTANKIDNPRLEGYGLHDTNFGIKLWQAGIPISLSNIVIGQRKLIKLGEPGTNEGAHQIEEWTEVEPDYLLKKFQDMPPQEKGKLVTVKTKDGELNVHPDKAKKLVKAGVAEAAPNKSVLFDFNGLEI